MTQRRLLSVGGQTAVRALAGDGAYNDQRSVFPAPLPAGKPSGTPMASASDAGTRRGAENQLVLGNPIARGGAFAYQRHDMILSLRPRFALGPFSFGNCCYPGSRVHDLARASIVG